MPAHVEKSSYGPIGFTHNDDALATHLTQEVIARIRNSGGTPGTNPAIRVETLHFVAEDTVIGEVSGGKSVRPNGGCSAHAVPSNIVSFDFRSKNAVVTGGASGIGFAIAKSMAEAGAVVSLFDLKSDRLADAARSIGAGYYEVDVVDRHSIEDAFARIEVVDSVIVNAGVGSLQNVFETTANTWDRTLAVNLSGAFHTLQAAAGRLKKRRRGSIVLTASTNSYDG